MRKSVRQWSMPESLVALFGAALCLFIGGCAAWQAPQNVDYSSLSARAVTATVKEVRVRAAALSTEDSRRLFGADVNATGVQPVWIEVQNNTRQTLWLLRSGTDPDYFSPLEVAWSFHKTLASDTNAAIDDHFNGMGIENPIGPGETKAGIIFANPHRKTMLLNVDLLGQGEFFPFTLFPPVPDDGVETADSALESQFEGQNITDYQDPVAFRAALEQLPCCASSSDPDEAGDPLNVIAVGQLPDIAAAAVRRGFRREEREQDLGQRLFGRSPDFVVRKAGHGGVPAEWLRAWVAPLRYQGQSVFLVQAGRPVGGRFAVEEARRLLLHPNVDEARNFLVQDMLYSGGLGKLAFVKGSGKTEPHYYTDGLRAVLFFVTRPLALSDVDILDWEPYLEQREQGVDRGGQDDRK